MASEQGKFVFIRDVTEITGTKPVSGTRTRRPTNSKSTPKVFDCLTCGLNTKCKSPRIERLGKGEKSILIVGCHPGRDGDNQNNPMAGASEDFVRRYLEMANISLYNDCFRTNVVRCYPGKDARGKDKDPTDNQIKSCNAWLQKDIEECRPQLIICLGTEAAQAILKTSAIPSPNVTHLHGKVFPYHKLNCWVGVCNSPRFFLRRKNNDDGVYDDLIFAYDLANILGVLGLPLPKPFLSDGNQFVTDIDEALKIFDEFSKSKDVVAFDYESTSLSPLTPNARIINVSLSNNKDKGYYIPIDLKISTDGNFFWPEDKRLIIREALKNFITSDSPKTIQNYQMEELWSRIILGVSIKNFVHDTMLTFHVINNRTGNNNLAFQAYEFNGQEYKGLVDIENIEKSCMKDQVDYSVFDSRHTIAAYNDQRLQLKSNKKLADFNEMFTKSLPTLVNIKERGIRVSIEALNDIESEFMGKINERIAAMRQDEQVQKFEKASGEIFNLASPKQWNKILYEGYGLPPIMTEKGNESTSNEAIEEILKVTDNPKVKELLGHYVRYKKYADVIKKVATAPSEISKQVGLLRRSMYPDGKIHPTTNLHTVPTYRSSVTDPPTQNMYKHDAECRSVRRCIIPEPGHVLLEGDYKAHEARNIGMASGDVELIRQTVAKIDIHKKWAGKIWKIPIEQVTSDQKYGSKNGFVFPSIYGSKPKSISKHLEVDQDFIRSLQEELWAEFTGVREWQRNLIKFYNENGYVEGLSGYRCYGPLTAYRIYNFPIQGQSFHILLAALTEMDNFLINNGFKSRIINEIHDAMIIDTHPDEIEDVIAAGTEIMCRVRWPWMNVPLDVSWETGPNWFDMKEAA